MEELRQNDNREVILAPNRENKVLKRENFCYENPRRFVYEMVRASREIFNDAKMAVKQGKKEDERML